MSTRRTVSLGFAAAALALAWAMCGIPGTQAAPASIAPGALKRVATVDVRFQSYNVEMAEVIGARFWKPYDKETMSKPAAPPVAPPPAPGRQAGQVAQVGIDPGMFAARPPADLANARLRALAAALGPAGTLPALQPLRVQGGRIELAPASITFLAVADAGNPGCK